MKSLVVILVSSVALASSLLTPQQCDAQWRYRRPCGPPCYQYDYPPTFYDSSTLHLGTSTFYRVHRPVYSYSPPTNFRRSFVPAPTYGKVQPAPTPRAVAERLTGKPQVAVPPPITPRSNLPLKKPAHDAKRGKPTDLFSTAKRIGGFETLLEAATAANLMEDLLKEGGRYTIFAPPNKAFDKLPKGAWEKLRADRTMLRRVLLNHVALGKLPAAEIVKAGEVQTTPGGKLPTEKADETVTVGGAKNLQADIDCTNGMIQVIDRVLIPEGVTLPAE